MRDFATHRHLLRYRIRDEAYEWGTALLQAGAFLLLMYAGLRVFSVLAQIIH